MGSVDRNERMTGDQIAYIYPNSAVALVGTFENGGLVSGRLSKLLGLTTQPETSILVPSFEPTTKGETVFFYEPSNQTYLGRNPLQRDPFEDQSLFVQNSTIAGAGRGIFVKKCGLKDDVVGFYNGVRLTGMESKLKLSDRKSPYRMDNDWAEEEQILNIPEGYRYFNNGSKEVLRFGNFRFQEFERI